MTELVDDHRVEVVAPERFADAAMRLGEVPRLGRQRNDRDVVAARANALDDEAIVEVAAGPLFEGAVDGPRSGSLAPVIDDERDPCTRHSGPGVGSLPRPQP